ncbi:MAG: tyrosine--tRNA ligase [Anaplasmataceae bacterium]|nr:tyrosine--tRNA ligase [Anaplasmataceae bacterium]
MATTKANIDELLSSGVEEIIDAAHLKEKLRSGKKLRIKLGIDPTGSKIHIGRAVVLWKLRAFQDLGHKIVLIVGDFTAQIGDASDKLEKRPFLTPQQVKNNLKQYLAQIGKIIDLKKTEIHYNSRWLKKLNFQQISELAEIFTIQQMIARRNFKERWEKNQEISLRELLYPIMQGYDSVMVKSDVEIGGTDQLFNLLAGRKIQEHFGQSPQDIITVSMLSGLDGRKMSTSWGNVINIVDSPDEQFGKIMSMRDEMIVHYLELATGLPEEQIKTHKEKVKKGAHPKEMKMFLAYTIVARYHGEKKAQAARDNFNKKIVKKDFESADLPDWKVKKNKLSVIDIILSPQGANRPNLKSKHQAQILINQGAVRINGKIKKDMWEIVEVKNNDILKMGKHQIFRIRTT